MRNPLRKRYLRELKSDFGKYIAIALFMVILIGMVSGYLASAASIEKTFYEGWEKYHIEDGHITFSIEPTEEFLEELEEKADITFYNLEYVEEDIDGQGTTLRIFEDRTKVNEECLMNGTMPKESDEIAIDRNFANNNEIEIGDTITLNGKEIKVTGIVALVDFNCLFENNTDMMFNSTIFGVGVMSKSGYQALESEHVFYNYAWKYDSKPINEKEENQKSEEFIEILEEGMVPVDNYVPKYQNKAITYCMDDMSSDKPMFLLFGYIVIAIIAFVFTVTISSTIQKEAAVIGTLRASGYTKGELVRHYLFMPVMITLVAAVIGNALGYTVFVNFMKNVFYNSFSLATYEAYFSWEAFVNTTIVPFVIMIVVNLLALIRKLQLSPIKFLRRDLVKKKKRRAVLLNKKLPLN